MWLLVATKNGKFYASVQAHTKKQLELYVRSYHTLGCEVAEREIDDSELEEGEKK